MKTKKINLLYLSLSLGLLLGQLIIFLLGGKTFESAMIDWGWQLSGVFGAWLVNS